MKRILLGGLVLVAAVVLGVVFLAKLRKPPDVRGSSTAEFVTTTGPIVPKVVEPGIAWPMYGFSPNRLRVGPGTQRPPFRRVWLFHGLQLLEFPPAIGYGRLYVANAHGTVFAVDVKTGKTVWTRETGRCQASSPAIDGHLVYFTFLGTCNGKVRSNDGLLVAYAAKTGKIQWQRRLGQSESSPVVYKGHVYVGDWTGAVSSYDARTGKLVWRFTSAGKVKSAVAISGNRLFFGSYDHEVYALNLTTGKLIWRAAAQNRGFRSRGTFYSGPAVAYGRVYIGSTDGKVYSFGAASGRLRWVTSTGNWVYSSPAVWDQRVYAGSYDGRLYCFDAATGVVKWQFKANGKISGSPTIIDGIVYFATFAKLTYGLDAKTGTQLWTFPDGEYTPVVADADHLFLVGRARIYALESKVSAQVRHGRRKRSPSANGRPASSGPTPS